MAAAGATAHHAAGVMIALAAMAGTAAHHAGAMTARAAGAATALGAGTTAHHGAGMTALGAAMTAPLAGSAAPARQPAPLGAAGTAARQMAGGPAPQARLLGAAGAPHHAGLLTGTAAGARAAVEQLQQQRSGCNALFGNSCNDGAAACVSCCCLAAVQVCWRDEHFVRRFAAAARELSGMTCWPQADLVLVATC